MLSKWIIEYTLYQSWYCRLCCNNKWLQYLFLAHALCPSGSAVALCHFFQWSRRVTCVSLKSVGWGSLVCLWGGMSKTTNIHFFQPPHREHTSPLPTGDNLTSHGIRLQILGLMMVFTLAFRPINKLSSLHTSNVQWLSKFRITAISNLIQKRGEWELQQSLVHRKPEIMLGSYCKWPLTWEWGTFLGNSLVPPLEVALKCTVLMGTNSALWSPPCHYSPWLCLKRILAIMLSLGVEMYSQSAFYSWKLRGLSILSFSPCGVFSTVPFIQKHSWLLVYLIPITLLAKKSALLLSLIRHLKFTCSFRCTTPLVSFPGAISSVQDVAGFTLINPRVLPKDITAIYFLFHCIWLNFNRFPLHTKAVSVLAFMGYKVKIG